MADYMYDRQDGLLKKATGSSKLQKFLYKNKYGNFLLEHIFSKKWFSILSGFLMDTRLSTLAINSFIKNNKIKMSEYHYKHYDSFNDFFIRKIRAQYRPINHTPEVLISPCDSKVMAYQITNDLKLTIKNNTYTVNELVKNESIAKQYKDGICLVLRLGVDDYHRYCYIDEGRTIARCKINGKLHTVSHISSENYRIYAQNSRECTIMKTKNFGIVTQVEVGALLVGKICNKPYVRYFERGAEKGYFRFGGSTIVLLFKKDMIVPDHDILFYSQRDIETKVQCGERIGIKKSL